MTSRRLSDVTGGAHNLSTLVQQQLSDSVLDDIAAVNSYRRVFFIFFSQRILLFSIMYCGLLLCCRFLRNRGFQINLTDPLWRVIWWILSINCVYWHVRILVVTVKPVDQLMSVSLSIPSGIYAKWLTRDSNDAASVRLGLAVRACEGRCSCYIWSAYATVSCASTCKRIMVTCYKGWDGTPVLYFFLPFPFLSSSPLVSSTSLPSPCPLPCHSLSSPLLPLRRRSCSVKALDKLHNK